MTTFTTQRVIPVSQAAVFAAFQDPERLARWWGPDGFTNTFDTFEFERGGRWVLTMHGPNGTNYPNESVFVSLVANSEFVLQHVSPPQFQLTVRLLDDPAGTLLIWEQAFDHDAFAESIRHIIEPANEQNLDRLSAEVLGSPQPTS